MNMLALVGTTVSCLISLHPRVAQGSPDVVESFEAGAVGQPVLEWHVSTPGYTATVTAEDAAEGQQSLKFAWVEDQTDPFGNLMRRLPAGPFAGRHIVLSAKVRAESSGNGVAQMWLRVDRPDGQVGAFDNMANRPVRPGPWVDAIIEADVDEDAEFLNIGFMSVSRATVWIDSLRLVDAGPRAPQQPASPPKPISARGLENLCAAAHLVAYVRFFDASDAAVGVKAWDHFTMDLMDRVEDASDPSELAQRLTDAFRPIAPTLDVWSGSLDQAPAPRPDNGATQGWKYWEHTGAGAIRSNEPLSAYSSRVREERRDAASGGAARADAEVIRALPGGVCCRLALRMPFDAEGTVPHATTPSEWRSTEGRQRLSALDRSTRLAGVALAWGIFQHFYPYFDVVQSDWDAALPAALSKAAEDSSETAYLATLRELVAKLHDGHGYVHKLELMPGSMLPLAVEWAGQDLVVVGRSATVAEDVRIGDVVVSIDGRPIEACYADVARSISAATEGWRRYRSQGALMSEFVTADPAVITFRHPDGTEFTASVDRGAEAAWSFLLAIRPDNGADIGGGIVYFDLNGAPEDELQRVATRLDGARGIVFDLRGYPKDAAMLVLQRLIREPATSARWNVPIVTHPDGEGWSWDERGRWNLTPLEPHWAMPVAFITDGRAISYAESILGIVEHYKLGEIVGSTTAGTNGNVNPFELPGGYRVSWTGMKVLKHDGSQHHGIGIRPTVPVLPTPGGIARERDEVLERAIEVLREKLAAEGK
jgi:hypothetical protein